MGNTATVHTTPLTKMAEEGKEKLKKDIKKQSPGVVDGESKASLSKDIMEEAKSLTLAEARYFIDAYYALQKQRVGTGNQAFAAGKTGESNELITWLNHNMEWLEKQITRPLQKFVEAFPEGRWAQSQYGIGTVLAAGCLVYAKPEICITAGKVWKTFGLVPGQRRKAGEKVDFNPAAKVLAWKIGQSFVKVSGKDDSYYGKKYRERKAYEQAKNENLDYKDQADLIMKTKKIGKDTEAYKWYTIGKLPPGHIQQRAERWATKLFLSHFAQVRYESNNKTPWPVPFAIGILGHADTMEPPGWERPE